MTLSGRAPTLLRRRGPSSEARPPGWTRGRRIAVLAVSCAAFAAFAGTAAADTPTTPTTPTSPSFKPDPYIPKTPPPAPTTHYVAPSAPVSAPAPVVVRQPTVTHVVTATTKPKPRVHHRVVRKRASIGRVTPRRLDLASLTAPIAALGVHDRHVPRRAALAFALLVVLSATLVALTMRAERVTRSAS